MLFRKKGPLYVLRKGQDMVSLGPIFSHQAQEQDRIEFELLERETITQKGTLLALGLAVSLPHLPCCLLWGFDPFYLFIQVLLPNL